MSSTLSIRISAILFFFAIITMHHTTLANALVRIAQLRALHRPKRNVQPNYNTSGLYIATGVRIYRSLIVPLKKGDQLTRIST